MIKLFVFVLCCITHLACSDSKSEVPKVKGVAAKKSFKKTILWTVDGTSDGKFYAIGGDDNLLRLYEAKNIKLLKTYKLPGAVQCLDWHPNGKLLAIALDDSPVQVLNFETGKFLSLDETIASRALAWNTDGSLLAVGSYNNALQIWSKEGKLLRSIDKDNSKTPLGVDWHPTKNIVLTVSDKIRLFDTSGTVLKSIKHRNEETIILTVKWHPDGTFFATGDYGHKEEGIESLLQFWKEDGTLIKSIQGSKAEFRNVRWNKEGNLLATASDALRLWSKDGQLLYTGKSNELLWGLDWNSQSTGVITSSENGSVNVWTNQAKLVKTTH
jgi:WD40 repeat protein